MASRTNIFPKCQKLNFYCNIIHRHHITLRLKSLSQYLILMSQIFEIDAEKQCKSVKAIPNDYPLLKSTYKINKNVSILFHS